MECQLEEAFEAVARGPADSSKRQSVSKRKGSVVGGGVEAKSVTLDPKVTSTLNTHIVREPKPRESNCLRVDSRTSWRRLHQKK